MQPDPARLLRARGRIRDYLGAGCASQDDIDDVVLCIEEACTNAIQHSRSREDLEIEIACENDWLSVRVRDHGVGFAPRGFDPDTVPDPTATGGRGLYLIARVMDEMEVHCDGGTTVLMRRRISVPSAPQRQAVAHGPAATDAGAPADGERRLFSSLADYGDGFVALDWEWRVVYANPAAFRLMRLPGEQLLDGPIWPLFPEMQGTHFERHARLAMEQGIPSHFEGYFAPLATWYDLRVYPTTSGVSVHFNEINERKRIESERDELLKQAERERSRLQTVLDVLPVAVGITDADGRVIALNPRASQIWAGDAPLPKGPADYGAYKAWRPDTGEPMGPEDWTTARVLRSRESILGELIEIERFDGTRGVVISSSVPIKDSSGDLVGAVGVTEDVTRHHRSRRLSEALNGLNALIHSTLDMDEIMRRLVGEAALALSADAVAIELREGDALPVRYSEGLPPNIKGRSLTTDSIIARTVAKTGHSLVVFDTAADPLLAASEISPFRSLIAIPLISRDDTFGVLVFLDGHPGVFDEPAVDFAERLGASVSLALENARLFAAIVAAETRVTQELQLTSDLLNASRSLTSSLELPKLLDALLRLVNRLTGRPRVFVNAVDEEHGELTTLASIGGRVPPAGSVVMLEQVSPLSRRAIAEARTQVLDWDADQSGPRVHDEYAARLVLFVPLLANERSIGHICVDTPDRREPFSEREIALVEGIAAQAAMGIANARLYEDIATRERLGSALNTINASIASVLDHEEILKRVIALTGSAMAAHSSAICFLEDGAWVPSTVWQQPAEVIGVRIPKESAPYATAVIETRAVVTVDDCANDPRVDHELQASWGVTAVMVAPLVLRDVVAAGLFVNYHDGPHYFTTAERDFLDKAAAAISGALARAEMYASEHRIAQTLQDALLALPERIPGLRFAHRYHSAAEVARVGGDFYDVFELDHGLLGITVGDMSGKGLDAAVLTSLMKNTIRAHAVQREKTPAEIMSMANAVLCLQSGPEHFATVFFAILDLRSGRLVYCNAGHPAPAILGSGHDVSMLPANSPLVGAFLDVPFANAEVGLATEDVMLLYTDGLTEAREGETLFGEKRLAELLEECRGLGPEALVQRVAEAVDSFAEGRLADDLALLAIQRLGLQDPAPFRLRADSANFGGPAGR